MQTPAVSKLGRTYGYRPPHEGHPLLKAAKHCPDAFVPTTEALVDWRPLLTPVRDQGQEGSCFAHAAAAEKEFNCAIWGGGTVPLGGFLSVAYLSWRTRLAMGTFPADSGASIADVMAILQAYGACPETFLPYLANPAQAGNAGCDVAAVPYRVRQPVTVPMDAQAWCNVLAARRCIVIGFSVYPSFEDTGPDGVVSPVRPGEGLLGGHAVLVVGFLYLGGALYFIARNSWAGDWGLAGHCLLPASYLANVWEAWTTA